MTVANQPKLKSVTGSAISASDMPEGWVETTLDQPLQSLESGSRPKGGVRGITEGIPSIGGEHLNENGGFRFESIKFVPYSFFERMNQGHIQTGDILIVKDGATTGKVALVRDDFPYNPAVVNEHVFICRPDEGVYPAFLFYFLFSNEGQDRILENFRGSAQGGINKSFTLGTAVPLAPLAEQKRIVAKVEELLARLNVARERLAKVPEILKRFRQSVLAAACSGRLTHNWRKGHPNVQTARELVTKVQAKEKMRYLQECENPKKNGERKPSRPPLLNLKEIPAHSEIGTWTMVKMDHAFRPDGLFDGPFGSNLKTCDYTKSGVRVIRLENIGFFSFINEKKIYICEEKYQSLRKHTVGEGDIIFASFISEEIRAVVLPKTEKAIAKADCFCLRPLAEMLDPRYLSFILSSPQTYSGLLEAIHGATRPRITTKQLKNLIIPLAPLDEQKEMVSRIEALFKLADQIERRVAAARERAERLTQAILAKAFRGELLATEAELARLEGRSYVSASTLLAKIKSQRKDVKPKQKCGTALQRRNNISSLAS